MMCPSCGEPCKGIQDTNQFNPHAELYCDNINCDKYQCIVWPTKEHRQQGW